MMDTLTRVELSTAPEHDIPNDQYCYAARGYPHALSKNYQ